MPTITPKPIEATQWFPGVKIADVVEETRVAKSGDPEVSHGLLLLKGREPLKLKTAAKEGETISAGRAHLNTPDGHSTLVEYGDWVVLTTPPEVLSEAEFAALFGSGK